MVVLEFDSEEMLDLLYKVWESVVEVGGSGFMGRDRVALYLFLASYI